MISVTDHDQKTRISPSCFVHQWVLSSSVVARIRWLVQSFGWLLGSQNWWLFMGLPETVGHGGFALPNEERVKVARCMLLLFVPSWFFFISGTFTHSLHSDMSWYATSKCFSRWFTAKGQVLVKSRIVEFRGYQDHCQRPNNFVPRHQSFFEAVANWLRPPTWGNREGCYTLPEILTNCLTRIIPWPQLSDLICQILVCRN